jgi:hypothetical protein
MHREFPKEKKSPFLLLTADDATFRKCPGINSSNICNVLLGGHSSGTATFSELIIARAMYEAPCVNVSMSMGATQGSVSRPRNNQDRFQYTDSESMHETKIIDHLVLSTAIIVSRIWSEDTIQKYV